MFFEFSKSFRFFKTLSVQNIKFHLFRVPVDCLDKLDFLDRLIFWTDFFRVWINFRLDFLDELIFWTTFCPKNQRVIDFLDGLVFSKILFLFFQIFFQKN